MAVICRRDVERALVLRLAIQWAGHSQDTCGGVQGEDAVLVAGRNGVRDATVVARIRVDCRAAVPPAVFTDT